MCVRMINLTFGFPLLKASSFVCLLQLNLVIKGVDTYAVCHNNVIIRDVFMSEILRVFRRAVSYTDQLASRCRQSERVLGKVAETGNWRSAHHQLPHRISAGRPSNIRDIFSPRRTYSVSDLFLQTISVVVLLVRPSVRGNECPL